MTTSPKGGYEPIRTEARSISGRRVSEDSRLPHAHDPHYLRSLADELGVKAILFRPLTGIKDQHPGVDAMLVPLSGGYSVVINENAPVTRQRYSLAHELGHIILHETESAKVELPLESTRYRSYNSVPSKRKHKAEERLCDQIAAELLMPEELFQDEMRARGLSLKHVARLASLFRTSLTATVIRYWELLPEPCHLVRWRSSIARNGIVSPAWQMRNRIAGPHLRPLTALSKAKPNEFREVRENWRIFKLTKSIERLLVDYEVASRRYWRMTSLEVETLGFGRGDSRAAFSAVYLNRSLTDNQF